MKSSNMQLQKIAHAAILGLFVGLVIWLVSLCLAAGYAHRVSGDIIYELRIGPFLISTISRQTIDGSMVASISLHQGLLWFIGFLGLLTASLQWILMWRITRYKEGD